MRHVPQLGGRTPKVYAAIKRLRSARLAIRQSLGAAADPIVDIKLQGAILLAYRMNKLLDQQGVQIVKLEEKVLRSTAAIKTKSSVATTNVINEQRRRSSAATFKPSS